MPRLLLLMYLRADGLFLGVQKSELSAAAESLANTRTRALNDDSGLVELEELILWQIIVYLN